MSLRRPASFGFRGVAAVEHQLVAVGIAQAHDVFVMTIRSAASAWRRPKGSLRSCDPAFTASTMTTISRTTT